MLTSAEILDFRASNPGPMIHLETRIRAELGITPVRFVQLLLRAAQSMEGQEHDPVTAHRVLRETGRM